MRRDPEPAVVVEPGAFTVSARCDDCTEKLLDGKPHAVRRWATAHAINGGHAVTIQAMRLTHYRPVPERAS